MSAPVRQGADTNWKKMLHEEHEESTKKNARRLRDEAEHAK